MQTAITRPNIAGIQKSQPQCSGWIYHNPRKVNPSRNAGPKLLIKTRPALIMKPKIPANRPLRDQCHANGDHAAKHCGNPKKPAAVQRLDIPQPEKSESE